MTAVVSTVMIEPTALDMEFVSMQTIVSAKKDTNLTAAQRLHALGEESHRLMFVTSMESVLTLTNVNAVLDLVENSARMCLALVRDKKILNLVLEEDTALDQILASVWTH